MPCPPPIDEPPGDITVKFTVIRWCKWTHLFGYEYGGMYKDSFPIKLWKYPGRNEWGANGSGVVWIRKVFNYWDGSTEDHLLRFRWHAWMQQTPGTSDFNFAIKYEESVYSWAEADPTKDWVKYQIDEWLEWLPEDWYDKTTFQLARDALHDSRGQIEIRLGPSATKKGFRKLEVSKP